MQWIGPDCLISPVTALDALDNLLALSPGWERVGEKFQFSCVYVNTGRIPVRKAGMSARPDGKAWQASLWGLTSDDSYVLYVMQHTLVGQNGRYTSIPPQYTGGNTQTQARAAVPKKYSICLPQKTCLADFVLLHPFSSLHSSLLFSSVLIEFFRGRFLHFVLIPFFVTGAFFF